MSSLRLLGSVGEPINPEAWLWYHETIGGGRCPIVDTWWMTETGMILISPLPGITTTKPGSATFPFPGVDADVVDEEGKPVPLGGAGYLVLTRPWPAMLRGIYERRQALPRDVLEPRTREVLRGRRRARDKDGYFWLHGPRRRRDEDLRPPHLDDRGRIGARLASEGRGGGGRSAARTRSPARRSSPL